STPAAVRTAVMATADQPSAPRRSGTRVSIVPETTATSSITESAAPIVRLPPTARTRSPTPTGAGPAAAAGARATTIVSTTVTIPRRTKGARRPYAPPRTPPITGPTSVPTVAND